MSMHELVARTPAFVAAACAPDMTRTGPGLPSGGNDGYLLMVGRVGTLFVALPASAIERVIPMAALTPLPDAPPGIVGILNVGGAVLVAMDPRPRLGQPSPEFHPDQCLIVMVARTRYLLWVDAVEQISSVQPHDLDVVQAGASGLLSPYVARLHGTVVPVLSPEVLDPGLTAEQARQSNR